MVIAMFRINLLDQVAAVAESFKLERADVSKGELVPWRSKRELAQAKAAAKTEVDVFLRRLATAPCQSQRRGRLIFAMDATASREPSWRQACQIQGEMFQATESLGRLDIQLQYFRGYAECRTSPWLGDSAALLERMSAVRCQAGQTQIARVLANTIKEAKTTKVHALVFIGDCVEEDGERLGALAGELGLLGVPVFVFHELGDREAPKAKPVMEAIARRSGGAYCPFDLSSAQQLKELLSAVAVFAVGGRPALEDFGAGKERLAALLTYQPLAAAVA